MNTRPSKSLYVVLAALLVLLPLLAVLQYQWIDEVSQADRQRREESLNKAGNAFAAEFDGELLRVVMGFQIRDSVQDPDLTTTLRECYDASSATDPGLVRRVFLARPAESTTLQRLDPKANTLEPLQWPAEFSMLHEALQARTVRFGERMPPQPPAQPSPDGPPVVAIPIMSGPPPLEGWTIVELDQKVLVTQFIPAIDARHFGTNQAEYRIAVATRSASPQLIYKSDADFSEADMRSADLRIPLLLGPGGMRRGFGGPPEAPVFTTSWELLIQHRAGSLDAAIASLRHRNLVISFGILLMLASSVVLAVVSSHRARALAQLQMDFVARVSHELRTPLAIIRSAAYNVATGVVSDEKDIREYAAMMQTEGQRLSTMVDQILSFSRSDIGPATYNLRAVQVPDLVDRVLETMASALSQSRCEVDRDIAGNLPKVKADATALAECLQNLLSNAIKYGRNEPITRIRIDARRVDSNTVTISVEDAGPGIEPPDLPHIFEPFFRGRNVRSDAPGSGLGLNLVRRMMNAQGGRVTVESEPGHGARFTLHLTAVIEAMS